jgi:hypothetical protein
MNKQKKNVTKNNIILVILPKNLLKNAFFFTTNKLKMLLFHYTNEKKLILNVAY